MSAKTLFTFAGGVVTGLIIGVWLFSGPSPQAPQVPTPVTPSAPQVDTLKLQQQITQLEDLVAKDPENYQAWKRLGDNLFDIGEPTRSIKAYSTALAINDSDPNVWTDMGVMYRQTGDYAKAIECFQEAAQRSPTHSISRLNMGVVYVNDLRDFEKGIEAWEEFLRIEPSGPRSEDIRQRLESVKKMVSVQKEGTSVEPGGGSPAPADPSSYFPKPAP